MCGWFIYGLCSWDELLGCELVVGGTCSLAVEVWGF